MESEYKMPETGEFYVTPEIRADFDKNGYEDIDVRPF